MVICQNSIRTYFFLCEWPFSFFFVFFPFFSYLLTDYFSVFADIPMPRLCGLYMTRSVLSKCNLYLNSCFGAFSSSKSFILSHNLVRSSHNLCQVFIYSFNFDVLYIKFPLSSMIVSYNSFQIVLFLAQNLGFQDHVFVYLIRCRHINFVLVDIQLPLPHLIYWLLICSAPSLIHPISIFVWLSLWTPKEQNHSFLLLLLNLLASYHFWSNSSLSLDILSQDSSSFSPFLLHFFSNFF